MVSIGQTAWVQPFAYGQRKLFSRLLADMLNRGCEAYARPTCGGEQRITDCVGVDAFHFATVQKENTIRQGPLRSEVAMAPFPGPCCYG